MRKILIALVMATIAISLLVSNTFATEVIVNMYDYGANSATGIIAITHPSAGTSDSAWGQSFRSKFDNANLTVIQVWQYQASATGGQTAYLIGETGTFGSSSTPTGAVLATSNEVTVTAGTLTVTNYTFASGYILDSAVDYCFYIAGTSGDVTSEYIGIDNTAPISVDPSIGNAFYYDNGAWTAQAGTDINFIIYAQDGTAVSFNIGGDVTINENTNVYNVTASNATATIGSVNVTTGEINVGGVTAEFNNTAVTAGNVTAAGGVSVDSVVVNATVTDASLTLPEQPQNIMFYTLLILTFACIILMLKSGIPLINFVFGIMTLGIAAYSLQTPTIIFFGYIQMFAILMASLCMLLGYRSYRND